MKTIQTGKSELEQWKTKFEGKPDKEVLRRPLVTVTDEDYIPPPKLASKVKQIQWTKSPLWACSGTFI